MSISPSGPDGLLLTFVEEKGTCSAKFDGKDYPASSPTWPAGWMCAIAKNGVDEQIYVRGDKGIDYGTVMRVMGRISAGGFKKVSLVTEVEDGG